MVKKQKASVRRAEMLAVDQTMGLIAFISPLSATPQIIAIFGKQEASGVSLLSWVLYFVIGLVTLAYGYFHKLRPIIISQTLWTAANLLIIIGVLMYGTGRSFHANYSTLLAYNMIGKSLTILSFIFGAGCLFYWYKYKKLNPA